MGHGWVCSINSSVTVEFVVLQMLAMNSVAFNDRLGLQKERHLHKFELGHHHGTFLGLRSSACTHARARHLRYSRVASVDENPTALGDATDRVTTTCHNRAPDGGEKLQPPPGVSHRSDRILGAHPTDNDASTVMRNCWNVLPRPDMANNMAALHPTDSRPTDDDMPQLYPRRPRSRPGPRLTEACHTYPRHGGKLQSCGGQ